MAIAFRRASAQPVVAQRALIAAGVFVAVAAGSVPVTARLIAIGVPMLGRRVLLDDLGADVAKHLAPDVLVFLEAPCFHLVCGQPWISPGFV